MNPPADTRPAVSLRDGQNERARRHDSLLVLATGIAHDFNNYIAAIIGNNNVVMRALNHEQRARECGQRIEASANQALHLSDQLATYAGRVECTPAELDPQDLLEAVVVATASVLPRGVTVATDIAPRCPALYGDAGLLHRALANLVTNAAEAMVDMHGVIRVRASAPAAPTAADQSVLPFAGKGPWLALTVQDTGRGMTDAVVDRCCDPFFTTKIRGRGMGLPEALGIARLHRGHLLLQTAAGAGTAATLLIPVPADGDLSADD